MIGLSCAFVYSGLSIAIPIVIRHAIDGSIAPTNGHSKPLWPYLVIVVVLGAFRFGLNFTRRYATARTGIRVEARMRELLYQAYLRYPRAFYDRHATGQVVSRATNDLYPIRYFIGWGMTQGIQSIMMIVGIAAVLFFVNAKLAAVALIAMPAVFVLAFTFARKVMPISRQVQQLKADVTEAADEAVVGIEMVQAFGREDDVQARFAQKAELVRDGVLRQARVEAAFLPGLLFLPTLSIAAVVLVGGRDVIGGTLTYGESSSSTNCSSNSSGRSRRSAGSCRSRNARPPRHRAASRGWRGSRRSRSRRTRQRCRPGARDPVRGRALLVRPRFGGAVRRFSSRSHRAR